MRSSSSTTCSADIEPSCRGTSNAVEPLEGVLAGCDPTRADVIEIALGARGDIGEHLPGAVVGRRGLNVRAITAPRPG